MVENRGCGLTDRIGYIGEKYAVLNRFGTLDTCHLNIPPQSFSRFNGRVDQPDLVTNALLNGNQTFLSLA